MIAWRLSQDRLDIGFGDVIWPEPVLTKLDNTLLSAPIPELYCYKMETVIAEKFEAMISLGLQNSRLKDYYDLWILINDNSFDGVTVAESIQRTFQRRGTGIPDVDIPSLSRAYNIKWHTQWGIFLNKLSFDAPSLTQVQSLLETFFVPVIFYIEGEGDNPGNWFPEGQWDFFPR